MGRSDMATTKVTFVLLILCILQPYLKFSASGKHYLVETEDKMTKRMTKPPPPRVFGRSSRNGCVGRYFGYYSNTTNIKPVLNDIKSSDECAYRCLKHPKCKFWSYPSFGKYPGNPGATCYLKTGSNGWFYDRYWESGNKACGDPDFLSIGIALANNELPVGYVCDQGECINKCGQKYIIDGEYDLNNLKTMAYKLLTYNKSLPTYSKYHDNLIPCLRSCNKCCKYDGVDDLYVKVCKYYHDQFVKNKLRIN